MSLGYFSHCQDTFFGKSYDKSLGCPRILILILVWHNPLTKVACIYILQIFGSFSDHIGHLGQSVRLWATGGLGLGLKVWSTSSTAQGGGGSFKNRKPIGEIGCCESGMAERIH